MTWIRSLTLVAAAFASCAAFGQEIAVGDPWVRATVAGQQATGMFVALTAREDAALVAAASPVAGVVEIHEMVMQDNVMRMRAVPKVPLPAGRKVELRPGGLHVMLMGLRQALKPGDTVPVRLTVEGRDGRRSTVEVAAPVRPLAHDGR